jgi:hypothetical protein
MAVARKETPGPKRGKGRALFRMAMGCEGSTMAESWNEQPAPRNPYKCKRSSRQEGNKNAADRPKATGRLSTLAGT